MKKLILSVALSVGLINVGFSGVPTNDPIAIAHLNDQLKEAVKQLETAKNQLEAFKKEAEATKNRLEGITKFDEVFKDELSKTLDNFIKDIEASTFETFKNLTSFDDLVVGSGLETQMKDLAIKHENIERERKALAEKEKEIKKLREAFKTVETPKQREAIQNSITAEQMQYYIAKDQMDLAKEQSAIESRAQEKARQKSALLEMLYGKPSN